MSNKHTILRGLTGFIGIYHLLAGLVLIGPLAWIKWFGETLGGMALPAEPQFYYLARPLGTYLLAFGVMLLLAAYDPVKNRAMISVAVVLIALRVAQRVYYHGEVQQIFGVSPGRNLAIIGLITVIGICLAVLRIRLYREMHRSVAAG